MSANDFKFNDEIKGEAIERLVKPTHRYYCPDCDKTRTRPEPRMTTCPICNEQMNHTSTNYLAAAYTYECTCDGLGGNNDILCPKHCQANYAYESQV